MLYNKKGLSTVVTTLIIILLVLVAVGIIWIVVRGVIEQGADQIDTSSQCPLIDVRITGNGTCDTSSCSLTIERGSGGNAFDGVYVAVTAGSNTNSTYSAGNILELGVRNVSVTTTGIGGTPTKAAVSAYFLDSQNMRRLCTNSREYNLV